MKIAVIGCGVMASSIIKGASIQDYFCFTPSQTKARKLAQEVSGVFVDDLEKFKNEKIDIWLLGMKPQGLQDFARDFKALGIKDPYIVSMLAATEITKLESLFSTKFISRIMPNTPVAFSKGVTLLSHSHEVTNEQKASLEAFLKSTGSLHTLSEKDLELATLVSGCGPAFFYQFTDLLARAINEMGLSKELGQVLAKETLIGSARLVEERKNEELSTLISEVTSQKGVTIEAINRFREGDHYNIYLEALTQAQKRSEEIKRELN